MGGKEKLMILLRDRGYKTSASTVGRIMKYLKRRGEIVEPKTNSISAKRRWKRPYAVRKPSDYSASEPGDLVQVDTLDIRPLPGIILKGLYIQVGCNRSKNSSYFQGS